MSLKNKRQIFLDTETTGLGPEKGHRVIEIGCVELINRRFTENNFHVYLNPDREIEFAAERIHGLTNAFLNEKPRFIDIYETFIHYINGAELIMHNAPFDVGFLNHEFKLLQKSLGRIENCCTIVDTLSMARALHPGQRNNLDALCKRYGIDNANRQLHGGLLDAKLLGLLYLAMTSGQDSLIFTDADAQKNNFDETQTLDEAQLFAANKPLHHLRVVKATTEELSAHEERLTNIEKVSGKRLWQ